MADDIFRKVSLERLSSPEQLDTLLTVTSPKSWFTLIAVGVIIVMGVVWGIFGSLTTRVNAQGVLLKSGGVRDVITVSAGRITDISVKPGEEVKKGQIVARIDQPQLVDLINGKQQQLAAVKQASAQNKAAALQQEISLLQDKLNEASRVVSPFNGRVVDVKTPAGGMISTGAPVISIEIAGDQIKDLECILYVGLNEGKTITPGMDVQIAPATVKKEQYGVLLGEVTSVSDYPATYQGMFNTLGNEELVKALASNGAQLEVHVDLVPDSRTVSGYKWSSSDGPSLKINSGTPATGSIIVSRQRPSSMVFQ